MAAAAVERGESPAAAGGLTEHGKETLMEPLAWLGVLAVVIGLIGVVVLVKGRKNKIR
jgi:hypothetical protein